MNSVSLSQMTLSCKFSIVYISYSLHPHLVVIRARANNFCILCTMQVNSFFMHALIGYFIFGYPLVFSSEQNKMANSKISIV